MSGTKLPAVLGASVPKRNSGELRTNGWELSLKWKDKLANGIRYDVGLVLSDYQNRSRQNLQEIPTVYWILYTMA